MKFGVKVTATTYFFIEAEDQEEATKKIDKMSDDELLKGCFLDVSIENEED